MDNKPNVIPVQSGQPLPPSTEPVALPPMLEQFLEQLRRTGRVPGLPLTPAERAAKVAKRAERKAERNRKRDQRRKNRR